ncbi:hypothetical protein WEH80_22565 [Actinomycetes bacterium KLBMP 9759]
MDARDTKGDRRRPASGLAEVVDVLDVGPTAGADDGADDLIIFVDRLAAAGNDEATAKANTRIREIIASGQQPPGVRRLAEALAASVAEAPVQRRPTEDSVVSAMRGNALVVLEDYDAVGVAGAVAALLADGRRIVVTSDDPADLERVRSALPADAAHRALDALPSLSPAQLRELRRLLVTATPARSGRGKQQIPPVDAMPRPADVAELCAMAVVTGEQVDTGIVPVLLANVDEARREAVTSVARCVNRSLEAMHPRGQREWAWSLLSDLIYGQHRAAFDRMLEDTAQAVSALEHAREAPPVEVAGPLPAVAGDVLRRYRDFLESGGRSRAYFRSALQREVAPVLKLVRVGGKAPSNVADVTRVIEHIDLGQRLASVDAGCAELGISAPHDEDELMELADGLVKVSAAARSVGALRHDVLFIAENSPLSVPDVAAAEQVARAILDYAENGAGDEAGRQLDTMADALEFAVPAGAAAPEHTAAVEALRAKDAEAYAAAFEALGAARRQLQDESRKRELLAVLGEQSPRLAESWRAEPGALGLAAFVPIDTLLFDVPPADSADVVLVVGAARLGVERLLLTAVAPRMIAAVAPDEPREEPPSLLSVLQRASALSIRGRTTRGNGKVVRLGQRGTGVSKVG